MRSQLLCRQNDRETFIGPMLLPFKSCLMNVLINLAEFYLKQVTSIKILRVRIISAIMNFYLSHAIALQKLSNERSYKFSLILTLTEVISIRILRMHIISAIMNFYWSHTIPVQILSNECSFSFS